MNNKVDEEFKYIDDNYILKCICTEMKKQINNLKKEKKIFKNRSDFYRNMYLVLNDLYRKRYYE